MLGKLSIEVGGTTRYEIVKANGGVVSLRDAGHYGFESTEDAHSAAKLLGEAQVGKDYTVEPITLVTSRKGSPGRKPGSKNTGNGQTGTAVTTPAPAPAPAVKASASKS